MTTPARGIRPAPVRRYRQDDIGGVGQQVVTAPRVTTEAQTSVAGYRRGTHRTVAPEVTWNRVRPLLAAHGITRVADVTGLDRLGIPVFQAVRPVARTVSVSQGKGLDAMAARVSAVMEAIELRHAEQLPARSGELVTPRRAGLPYPLDALDLAAGSLVHPDLPLRWCVGTGLLSCRAVAVPVDLVRLDHTFYPEWCPPLFRATSNGLASGNTLDEATVHALAELCERDSLAYLRTRPARTWPRLDTGTVTDPDARTVLGLFDRDGTEVDVVVAATAPWCFEARIRSPLHPVTYTGAGCHLDPAVALLRALTEAAQSRLTGITGARDDLPDLLYQIRRQAAAPVPTTDAPRVAWVEVATSTATGDLTLDLTALAGIVGTRTGFEPVRVALPSPHGIPVVKVIGPGLRFDDRADLSAPAAGAGS